MPDKKEITMTNTNTNTEYALTVRSNPPGYSPGTWGWVIRCIDDEGRELVWHDGGYHSREHALEEGRRELRRELRRR